MSQDINLISKSKEEKKKINLAIMIPGGIFAAFFLVAAVLLFYSLALASKAAALDSQALELKGKISAASVQKAKILTVNERLSSIRKIIAERRVLDKRMETVLSIMPQDITLDGITANDETVSVILVSPNLADFDGLLETGISELVKKKTGVVKVEASSFAQGTGGYQLTLDFYFNLSAAPAAQSAPAAQPNQSPAGATPQ